MENDIYLSKNCVCQMNCISIIIITILCVFVNSVNSVHVRVITKKKHTEIKDDETTMEWTVR